MESDIIQIDNLGNGFEQAVEETKRVAQFRGLDHKNSLRLQLCTEEMLSMAHTVTGEMQASFWLESEGNCSATSRKNEAANSFLGKLRDAFENAMASEEESTYFELPVELQADLAGRVVDDPDWDRYERSVLFRLADNVKIDIRGGLVHMTVTKSFA